MIDLWAVIAMAALTAVMVALLGIGVAKIARRAGDEASASRSGILVIMALQGWLLTTAALAFTGTLSEWAARPPRLPLLTLAALLAIVFLNFTAPLKKWIASTPLHWPIAAQTFRVAVELVLFAFFMDGHVPLQLTFEGRNLDILVGLTAPVMAWFVARKIAKPIAVFVWNVAGLAILLNTIVIAQSSVPGPMNHGWPGAPFTAIAGWPLVWLPTFLAPLAIFLHVVSLRQSVRLLRRGK
ncbi:MAG: hypothetical protein ABI461_11160 [Polyangiaceae bacterium]